MVHVWDDSGIGNDEAEEEGFRMHPSENFP